jgi:hypothetical protein
MNYYYTAVVSVLAIGPPSFLFLRHRIRPLRRGLLRRKPAVQMPKAYLRPRERRLRQLTFGETGAINRSDVAVDLNGKTWVEYDARLRDRDRYSTVEVRLEKGGCVLILPPPDEKIPIQFSEHRLYSSITTYLPVIAVAIEPVRPPEAKP